MSLEKEWLLPLSHRKGRSASSGGSSRDLMHDFHHSRPDEEDRSKTRKRGTVSKRWLLLAMLGGFIFGYYVQVLLFFLHVRMGFFAEVLPTVETSLMTKMTASLIQHTKRVIFVCKHTNWDFLGFVASPHAVIFAHQDVYVPPAIENTLSVVRHYGVDSYLNLHNKTITIMSHVHQADTRNHLMKQDEEAVIFWPHYYQCMKKCKNIGTCYAGDMHVNIGGVSNTNSYVFATGGSYFVGNELLKCILSNPVYVELDGLDFGEDKTVGKMIHYNKCDVQYVSCKWFNNKEIYSPNALVKMEKGYSVHITEDTELLGKEEQERNREEMADAALTT